MVTSYDAIVYDLDGTLVRLAVDWQETAEEIKRILGEHGETPNANDALDLVPIAEEIGAMEDIESHIAAAEREGARNSERLPDMDNWSKRTYRSASVRSTARRRAARRWTHTVFRKKSGQSSAGTRSKIENRIPNRFSPPWDAWGQNRRRHYSSGIRTATRRPLGEREPRFGECDTGTDP
ncbi:hypothetical protein GCM10009000_013320 [Halobacterium noricense]|uniref:Phosphoglycolate phosphatase n=1 Tax=Haladaptatus pallidirubidus TaxID=1008152 RepID=A0AAV3UB73_9EURY